MIGVGAGLADECLLSQEMSFEGGLDVAGVEDIVEVE